MFDHHPSDVLQHVSDVTANQGNSVDIDDAVYSKSLATCAWLNELDLPDEALDLSTLSSRDLLRVT